MKRNIFIVILSLIILSCEVEIDPELEDTLNIIVVDAWLTNNSTEQIINVTRSQSYFNSQNFVKVSGATVVVKDITDPSILPYEFEETASAYTWESADGQPFGSVGHQYELEVTVGTDVFKSSTSLNRVPPIDSISFRVEPANAFVDEVIYAEVFATDPVGSNDSYWLKTWKNGQYLGLPDQINIAFDAAFTGGNVDGDVFIQPIRDAINTFDQSKEEEFLSPINLAQTFEVVTEIMVLSGSNQGQNLQGTFIVTSDEDNSFVEYYAHIEEDSIYYEYYDPTEDEQTPETLIFENRTSVPEDLKAEFFDPGRFSFNNSNDSLTIKGDSVYVELHSISNEAYFFLNQVSIETNREGGFGALFATPLANVSTNIFSENPDTKVVGFFNIAAVSSKGRRLESENELRFIE